MKLRRSLRWALLPAATVLMAHSASAQTATPEQAAQLEAQIRGWLAGLFGAAVPLATHPVHVTPDGDHYRLSADIAGRYGSDVTVTADPVVATAKPLDANRWNILSLAIPSPLRIDNPAAKDSQPKMMASKIAEQTATGVLDLSFATTSTLDETVRDYTSTSATAKSSQTTHIARYVAHTALTPSGDGRIDVAAEGRAEAVEVNGTTDDGGKLAMAAASLDGGVHADKVAPQALADAVRTISALVPLAGDATGAPAPKNQGVPPAMRKPLRDLVLTMQDMASGFDERGNARGVRVQTAMGEFALDSAEFGLGLSAPGGHADLRLAVAIDGIKSPSLPPGPIQDFVPRRFVLKPHLGGIPTQDLVRLLLDAIDSDRDDNQALQADAMALLAKGPVSLGIDEFVLDAGPSSLKASGAVQVSAPADLAGAAQIRITAFDKLVQQAQQVPELTQALPVLIFLKGIGKADGDSQVWDVGYRGGRLAVNGTDLSALLPSDQSKPPVPQRTPRQQPDAPRR